MEAQTKSVLKVEIIQVEMSNDTSSSCSACDTVQGKLTSAIQEVQKLFDHIDCEILLKSTKVKNTEEAEKAQIIASPTIRVGYLDFYPNHIHDNSEEREWTWKDLTLPEPTKEILIEVLLKGYFEPREESKKMEMSPYILKSLNESQQEKSDCECS
ncbi:DUF2703 domain-containing protein [Echinicola vietnamensis]|uniref:DUF2703 domain-containing protein n=1 Tax=Echinicola vietnamensis (strain DSM 17526 / LMG 23754 / KMM 6221) TaxID=926556 RepID=L0G6L5_ECHVK|nr:DUF2703 domain-containing protein [Echinicola vietnamensis]AGA80490.1 Protein of unknown function (DUF2703) [Echinicola vietnamensis DSM 17526]